MQMMLPSALFSFAVQQRPKKERKKAKNCNFFYSDHKMKEHRIYAFMRLIFSALHFINNSMWWPSVAVNKPILFIRWFIKFIEAKSNAKLSYKHNICANTLWLTPPLLILLYRSLLALSFFIGMSLLFYQHIWTTEPLVCFLFSHIVFFFFIDPGSVII